MGFLDNGLRFYNIIIRELVRDKYERLYTEINGLKGDKDNVSVEALLKGNITLPKDSYIDARAVIEGNISFGRNCYVGPNSTIVDNVTIGNNVYIEAGTILSKSVSSNSYVFGNPAQTIKPKRKFQSGFAKAYHEAHRPKKQKIKDYFKYLVDLRKNVQIGNQVYLEGGAEIQIGDNSIIGDRVNFATSHHIYDQNQEFLKSEERWDDVIIGKNVNVGCNTVIRGKVKIGNNVTIAPGSVVVDDIPDNTIASGCPAEPNAGVNTPKSTIFPAIGNEFAVISYMYAPVDYFNTFKHVHIKYKALINKELAVIGDQEVEIQKGAMIAPRVTLVTQTPLAKGSIKIEEHSWIGSGATILPGVTIKEGAVVGAGAVVYKDVEKNQIWVGNPAKYKKNRF